LADDHDRAVLLLPVAVVVVAMWVIPAVAWRHARQGISTHHQALEALERVTAATRGPSHPQSRRRAALVP
jgi:hypothetical protein